MIHFLAIRLFYKGVPIGGEPLLLFHPVAAEMMFDSFDEHTTWEYII